MNNNPIGVFDSGVGGLSCVPAIKKALPNETIIYFGDTKNAPYGTRSKEEIIDLSLADARRLVDMGCKALAIACNTISATAIPALRKEFSIPIIGIIEPAVDLAKKEYSDKKVGVIATKATVESGAYPFDAKSASEFVPFIENEGRVPDEVIQSVLSDFAEELDVLILGCTHFPFAKDDIKRLYPELELLNPAEALANRLKEELVVNNLLSEKKTADKYFASLETEVFKNFVRRIECTI